MACHQKGALVGDCRAAPVEPLSLQPHSLALLVSPKETTCCTQNKSYKTSGATPPLRGYCLTCAKSGAHVHLPTVRSAYSAATATWTIQARTHIASTRQSSPVSRCLIGSWGLSRSLSFFTHLHSLARGSRQVLYNAEQCLWVLLSASRVCSIDSNSRLRVLQSTQTLSNLWLMSTQN